MEATTHIRGGRGRGRGGHDPAHSRPHSRNKQWVANPDGAPNGGRSSPYHSDSEGRWERGGHRGGRGGRGAFRGSRGKFPNATLRVNNHPPQEFDAVAATIARLEQEASEVHMESPTVDHFVNAEPEMLEAPHEFPEIIEPALETKEEQDEFWKELVKARDVERKKAIAEGTMDDPLVPKRLEDAICMVGTCMDMCPRFERFRRERESNLDKFERIPGTRRVDHNKAVKMYERASGDKIIPSDLRPPEVLKRTLDYLFHDLILEHGFSAPVTFIRDRSRAVRNDFTIQHNHGRIAIECHDRCARFHILALHLERDNPDYSIVLEEQQLMNTLQSLKEFYEEQRATYESPTELEMRVYHRLIHMRDQRERHDDIPDHIQQNPVFKLTTDFRLHVQRKSAPISKRSKLIVDGEAMQIFAKLADVLREQGNVVMIYLVACILERNFGKEAIDNIESIRGDLSFSNIIDGVSTGYIEDVDIGHYDEGAQDEEDAMVDDFLADDFSEEPEEPASQGQPLSVEPSTSFPAPSQPSQPSAFSAFGGPSAFSNLGQPSQPSQPVSAFSSIAAAPSAFSTSAFASSSFSTAPSQSAFGKSPFSVPPTSAPPAAAPAPAPAPAAPSIPNFFANTSQTSAAALNQPVAEPSKPPSSNGFPTTNGSVFNVRQPTQHLQPPSLFGDSQISRKQPTNGFAFPSVSPQPDGPSRPPTALNPDAPTFTPGSSGSGSQPPPTLFSQPFARSSNPSPSPLFLGSAAPPTPAGTPALNGTPAPAPFPPPMPMRTRKSSTPPVLPKIDTTNTQPAKIPPPTPTIPPPAPKQQPISLPSTPTVGAQPPNPLLNRIHDQLKTPATASPGDILSPIALQSPHPFGMPSLQNFPPNGRAGAGLGLRAGGSPMITSPTKPSFLSQLSQPSQLPLRLPTPERQVDEAALEAKADEFASRSYTVKSAFRKWHQLILDRAAYLEAVRQGDKYSQKIKRQRHSEPDKKRKVSSLVPSEASPTKKRIRRRVSSTYKPPRTDEELAQRLQENHTEHERRWAQGTFLQVIKDFARRNLNGFLPHPSWRAWLSMNPDNDATAIWVEKKFNVPASGSWATESVFALPLLDYGEMSVDADAGFPGLIVFECTPLEDVSDEIERKYRILDDCARLRDVVAALPPKRYFKPSLLLLSWTQAASPDNDLAVMIKKLQHSGTIKSYGTLSISTTNSDLDEQLAKKLVSLSIDLQGELARTLSWPNVMKLFEAQYASFVSEWLDNCLSHGHFNWRLLSDLVTAITSILNHLVSLSGALIGQDIHEIFAPTGQLNITDDSSAYEKIIDWLSTVEEESASQVIFNLQSRLDIGHEFPVRDLFDQLWGLALSESWRTLDDQNFKYHVLKSDIAAATTALKQTLDKYQRSLSQTLHMSVRRSPASVRRRSVSQDTDLTSSQLKRPRLFSPTPTDSLLGDGESADAASPEGMNGRISPSPSVTSLAPSETPAPVVTLAMLRALTKDIKKKYGASA